MSFVYGPPVDNCCNTVVKIRKIYVPFLAVHTPDDIFTTMIGQERVTDLRPGDVFDMLDVLVSRL